MITVVDVDVGKCGIIVVFVTTQYSFAETKHSALH